MVNLNGGDALIYVSQLQMSMCVCSVHVMCANNVGRTLPFNSLVAASGEPLLEFTRDLQDQQYHRKVEKALNGAAGLL